MNKLKKLLVIGGTGFVGRNIIDRLKNKYKITSVSYSRKVVGVKNINVDLTKSDFSFLSNLKPDFIVYLGTISSPRQGKEFPVACMETNINAPIRMLNRLKGSGIKKVIFFSSVVLYKEKSKGVLKESDSLSPDSGIYAFSKYILEELTKFYSKYLSLPITVFRLTNTYGPYQDVNRVTLLGQQMFTQAINEKKVVVHTSRPVRDWLYVGDVAKAVELELSTPGAGIFNLATGKGTSVGEIARQICIVTKSEFVDLEKKADPPFRIVCDISAIKKRYDWQPGTSISSGVLKTLKYYQERNIHES